MATPHTPSLAAKRAILKLGMDIKTARRRRRLQMETVAERAFTTRGTLTRIEKGDPGVSIGAVASVLHALGLIDKLEMLIESDPTGEQFTADELPQRIRMKRI
jgi:transcriptional regulator with XRE-family HTH domain